MNDIPAVVIIINVYDIYRCSQMTLSICNACRSGASFHVDSQGQQVIVAILPSHFSFFAAPPHQSVDQSVATTKDQTLVYPSRSDL